MAQWCQGRVLYNLTSKYPSLSHFEIYNARGQADTIMGILRGGIGTQLVSLVLHDDDDGLPGDDMPLYSSMCGLLAKRSALSSLQHLSLLLGNLNR